MRNWSDPGENRARVAYLLAKGKTVREIADELGITTQRVYQHRQKLQEKSGTPGVNGRPDGSQRASGTPA